MMKYIVPCLLIGWWTQAAAETLPFLSTSGSGKTIVKATLSDVRLALEVEGTTVKEVQERLSSRLDPLLDALKKKEPLKLETGTMSISPEYNKNSPPQIVGYRGIIEVNFTKEALKAGELIDEALKAGANKLSGVSLRPSETALRDARIASLQKACQNAMEEADVVLKALNIKSKGIKEVDIQPESHFGPIPMAFSNRMALKANMGESLEVLEQEQTITADVNIKMRLEMPN
jgi:uncharacterized protein